jgi:uncharacterized repeat protein (TIGR01451 family)
MRNLTHQIILTLLPLLAVALQLQGQGYERHLYGLQSASLITETGGDTLLINSALNHFHLIGKHGEVLESILHTNHQHPDDTQVGQELLDMHPYPMPNGDIVFFSRKILDPALGKSDILYFNYRSGSSKTFTTQTTLFLPSSLPELVEPGFTSLADYTFLNGHFYFSGRFQTTSGATYPVLMKINLNGELVWSKTYLLPYSTDGEISRLRAIDTTDNGRVLIALEYDDYEYYHLEVDEDGLETGGTYFPLGNDLSEIEDPAKTAYWIQPDGGLAIVGYSSAAGHEIYIFDADGTLAFSRSWLLGPVNVTEIHKRIHQVEGGFLVYRQNWEPVEGNTESITISKVNLEGDELVWIRTYVPRHYPSIQDVQVLESGNIVFACQLSVTENVPFIEFVTNIGYLLKLGPTGALYGSQFEGYTFEDVDPDCSQMVEGPQPGWLVAFQSPADTFYALSNAQGFYERPVTPNTYQAQLYPPNPYWSACPPSDSLEILLEDTLTHHFPAQAVVDCPNLVANISAPFLRRCFESTYSVRYCNTGTVLAQDAYLEVELDPELTYLSATLAPASVEGQLLRFDLGNIGPGQCGDFQITVNVNCATVLLGQSHCTTATIYPNTPCSISPDWSGASLEADARCEGDSVAFVIKNKGSAATATSVKFLVIEDQVILLEGDGGILAAEDSIELRFAANGSTYRIEVDQEVAHPGKSYPTASIERCTSDPGAPVSLGVITQYWEDDLDDFVSVDCQQNIGSYDPNDKRAYPGGVAIGNKNYIEPNQRITYHIRFQNTGTDIAMTVVIKDPVDPNLDLTTLKMEAASHPYQLEITPLRELVFTFENINLIDSFTNEPLSHGFISFSLEQLADLTEGTQIDNQAAIFFDFNLPIYTNTWAHEIKEDILPYNPLPPLPPAGSTAITVSPNPVSETAWITVEGAAPDSDVQLKIYDSRGMLYQSAHYRNNGFSFKPTGLPDGLYFIEAFSQGRRLGKGKMAVQK